MGFRSVLQRFSVTVVVGGVAVGACVAALVPGVEVLATSHYYTSDLVAELSSLSQRSTVYDSAGNELAKLGIENREAASFKEVPRTLIDAVVATEDATFWTNDGIDIGAVARAAVKNLTSGKIEQGGSTITQQLVKNRILTPKRDLSRKIREIILALRVDETFSKREILEQYLNTIYFGQGSYGVKSAAERFFLTQDPASLSTRGKLLSELTVGDSALLAGLIRNPEGDNPFVYPERARARRTLVLERMVGQRYITEEQAAIAEQEPLPTVKPVAELRPRDSWVEEVQDRLLHDPRYAFLGATVKERRERILRGGLRIVTTLDPKAQAAAQSAVDKVVPTVKPDFTGALVAIDPTSGAVRAMVAGRGFEQSQYNVVTSYPGRQSGSTWKVITLSTAIENGYSPNDLVDGTSPCVYGPPLGFTINAEGGGGYRTLRSATAGSVNCAFVRVELSLGFPKVMNMARRMGLVEEGDADRLLPILTLTLGSIVTTPLEMATVIATVASGGIHRDPYFVQQVVGPDGVVVFDESGEGERVLSPDTASCVIDLLRGVVSGGTGTAARLPDRQVAGKTGTTDKKADAWFLGATPQLVAAVWHGNLKAQVPGAGFGGGIPARTWRAFMESALAGEPALEFPAAGPRCATGGQLITEAGRQAKPEGATLGPGGVLLTPTSTAPPPTVVVKPPATTTTTKP